MRRAEGEAGETGGALASPVGDHTVRSPAVTTALLAVLVAVFSLEAVAADPSRGFSLDLTVAGLVRMGGLNRQLVLQGGEWHRALTAVFLHGSWLHLLLNGVALWMVGGLLEVLVGRAWLVALFYIGALGGSALGLAINGPEVVSVGASGAIMGLFAGAAAVAFRLPDGNVRREVQAGMLRVLIPSLIPLANFGHGQRIDYAAHLGGALAGGLAGLVLWKAWSPTRSLAPGRALAGVLAAVGVAASLAAGVAQAKSAAATASLMPDEELRRGDQTALVARADELVERWPRDPRTRLLRAVKREGQGDLRGAEEDLRAGLREEAVLRTQFPDRRVETSLRSALASVLMRQGREAEARAAAAPVCHAGRGGAVPPGLVVLGVCD